MRQMKIAVLVGSLRKESLNLKMAKNLIKIAPDAIKLEIVEIGQLPLYNADLDSNPPFEWVDFRQCISSYDGVLFVTPEYNRSVPGCLKNAVDIGSRPYKENVWNGKPAAVLSASPGAMGGFGASHHLRQSLVFINMPTMQTPEAYIGKVHELFDENGDLNNEKTIQFVRNFTQAFADWTIKMQPDNRDSNRLEG